MNRKKRNRPNRSGTAVVELALCLPLIFTIIFGSIEACNMIALKQIVSESAYDGALKALRPAAVEADILSAINVDLAARNVTPHNVSITGVGGISLDSISRGEMVIITVEALTNGNVVGPQLFGMAQSMSATATAIKQ